MGLSDAMERSARYAVPDTAAAAAATMPAVEAAIAITTPKRKKKRTLKGGISETQATDRLIANGVPADRVAKFLQDYKSKPSWRKSYATMLAAYSDWEKTQTAEPLPSVEVKTEEKKNEPVTYESGPEPPPVMSETDTPALPRGSFFKTTPRVFDSIKNTSKPKTTHRAALKSFFDELSIKSYNELPGSFVSGIHALRLPPKGNANDEQLGRLMSFLESQKSNLSKRTDAKPTTVTIKSVKSRVKKDKVVSKVPKVKSLRKRAGTIKPAIVVKAPRKPRKSGAKKGKGVEEDKLQEALKALI